MTSWKDQYEERLEKATKEWLYPGKTLKDDNPYDLEIVKKFYDEECKNLPDFYLERRLTITRSVYEPKFNDPDDFTAQKINTIRMLLFRINNEELAKKLEGPVDFTFKLKLYKSIEGEYSMDQPIPGMIRIVCNNNTCDDNYNYNGEWDHHMYTRLFHHLTEYCYRSYDLEITIQ